MTPVLLALPALLCAGAEVPCESTPELLRHVAPFADEYGSFAKDAQRDYADTKAAAVPPRFHYNNRNAAEAARKHRRGRRANPNPVGVPPISKMNFSAPYTTKDYWVASLAWKIMALLYRAEDADDRIDLVITTSPEKVKLSSSTVLLGTAAMNTRLITLYVNNIPSVDALVLVILHEMDHLLGFGTLASPTGTSFYARTNPVTLEFSSPVIAQCVADKHGYGGGVAIHSDATRSHWNMSSPQFDKNDLMKPLLSFGHSALSACTVLTVLESRPEWAHNLCFTDTDCQLTEGAKCISVGQHWISVCQTARRTQPAVGPPGPIRTATTFAVFSAVSWIFWAITIECRRRTRAQLPGHAPMGYYQSYPWKPPPLQTRSWPRPPRR